ncbi:Uncharacterised protein [uncultured archaeon]|nr:Uncharacterised protein [uncultured archaeon]
MNSLIESGIIRRREENASHEKCHRTQERFEMKFLDEGSLQELMALQSLVACALPCPEIFALHDESYFHELFLQDRSTIGVSANGELVAYSLERIPGRSIDNLGRDINLPDGELLRVIHLQAAAVHPLYRGNDLQRKMARAHLHVAREKRYIHACCTVSPKNEISLTNILASGFVIRGLLPKWSGWWRYVMYRNISCASSHKYTGETRIGIQDIQGQIELLKEGFVGFKLATLSKGTEILYGRIEERKLIC